MQDRGTSKEKAHGGRQLAMLQNTLHVVNGRGSPELKYSRLLNKDQREPMRSHICHNQILAYLPHFSPLEEDCNWT